MKKGKQEVSIEGRLAQVMRACADETRLRILNLLGGGGEICVCHLVEALGEGQPKVSRHLAYLRGAGLVRDRKDGLWVHYRLAESPDDAVVAVLEALREGCGESAARDLGRLEEVRCKQPILRLTGRVPERKPEENTVAFAPFPRELDVELL